MGFDEICNEVHKRDFLIPVSDTQAYRQFGNAVAVPIVQAIAKAMIKPLAQLKANELPNEPATPVQEKLGLEEQRKSA